VLTLLWARRRLPISATRHDARAHPSSAQSSSVNCERPRPLFSPLLAQKRRTHVIHRAFPLSRIGTTVKTSRTSGESFRLRSRYGPRAAERRTHLLTGELPSSNRSLEHPGRRILAPGGLETPPRRRDTAWATFRRRPAKGDGFRMTEVLCSASEPIEPPCWRRLDFFGARREIAPAHDAPDRPSVTPPLTFP